MGQVLLDYQLFEAAEAENLEKKKQELLLAYRIASNKNEVVGKELTQSYLEATQESQSIN